MSNIKGKRRVSASAVRDADDKALEMTNELEDVWRRLRAEGKAAWGRNLRSLEDILRFYDLEFSEHMKLEEDVVFPYLKKHVPRLEHTIHYLLADHEDFRRDIEHLETMILTLMEDKDAQDHQNEIERMNPSVLYLVYVLRHHIQVESKGIFNVIEEDLGEWERNELDSRIKAYLERK